MKYFVFLFLFLLTSNTANAKLSEKIIVKVGLPYNNKVVKKKVIEQQSIMVAKSLIIKKHIRENIKFPDIVKKHHKNFIVNIIYNSTKYKFNLINFNKEKSFKKNNSIFFVYSSKVEINNFLKKIDLFNLINELINSKELDPLLSLELALTYSNNLNILSALKQWKQKYHGSITYIVSNNFIKDPLSLKFIDKKFNSIELSLNVDEVIYLFDKAPFNLDICIQTFNVLNNKNYKTLAIKLLSSCKKVQSNKISEENLTILKNEISMLKTINIHINDNYLIYKIFKYGGRLPIKLFEQFDSSSYKELEKLIINFESKPNYNYLRDIRDKLELNNFKLLTKYLTIQLGARNNEGYQF